MPLRVEIRWSDDLLWHVWDSEIGPIEKLCFFGSQLRAKEAGAVYARKRAPSTLARLNKEGKPNRIWHYAADEVSVDR